ncbi:hypothetical protein CC1G_06166 [Coprinopsis cinerea okayama7|uniref:Uncharacterized protein n=1 Tax=Coprinopsis cinerea (strain Okayama-7 / 130 / ATCC MYA-4618 / FGSC 9003) TaxID=240176 RepID=A8NV19_COPC7|nr:hypothetical protein CC1G_06166 [Coprinopsis cinerea okayama7\|eukprot:XP_001836579.1 hypothetical protein CC1G_06166 [Coprinopsis cinerea okayama7\
MTQARPKPDWEVGQLVYVADIWKCSNNVTIYNDCIGKIESLQWTTWNGFTGWCYNLMVTKGNTTVHGKYCHVPEDILFDVSVGADVKD